MDLIFESRNCSLCGSSDHSEIVADELGNDPARLDYNFAPETRLMYRTVRCNGCGLMFANPMPDLGPFYGDVVDPAYMATVEQRRITARSAIEHVLRHKAAGTLVDIGCATGAFLDIAAKHYSVEGVELSSWAADIASEGHTVHRQPFEDLDFVDRFDAATMWDVIEHLPDPFLTMKAVAKSLRPGGVVTIYTGDASAILPRFLGRKWWWWQGMHVHYFTRHTLRALLEKAGLEVIERGTMTKHFSAASLAKSLRRYRLGPIPKILEAPGIKNRMIPVHLNGEMVMTARRP